MDLTSDNICITGLGKEMVDLIRCIDEEAGAGEKQTRSACQSIDRARASFVWEQGKRQNGGGDKSTAVRKRKQWHVGYISWHYIGMVK